MDFKIIHIDEKLDLDDYMGIYAKALQQADSEQLLREFIYNTVVVHTKDLSGKDEEIARVRYYLAYTEVMNRVNPVESK